MEVSGIALGYEQTAQAQYPGIALPEEWETALKDNVMLTVSRADELRGK